jgi:hypothetical protein
MILTTHITTATNPFSKFNPELIFPLKAAKANAFKEKTKPNTTIVRGTGAVGFHVLEPHSLQVYIELLSLSK